MGNNKYIKSTRRKSGVSVALDERQTSYRRLIRLRRIWEEYRDDWIKLGKPSSYKVVIIDNDEKENFDFITSKRNDGSYIVKIDEFEWVD